MKQLAVSNELLKTVFNNMPTWDQRVCESGEGGIFTVALLYDTWDSRNKSLEAAAIDCGIKYADSFVGEGYIIAFENEEDMMLALLGAG